MGRAGTAKVARGAIGWQAHGTRLSSDYVFGRLGISLENDACKVLISSSTPSLLDEQTGESPHS